METYMTQQQRNWDMGVKPYMELIEVEPKEFEQLDKQGVGYVEGTPTQFSLVRGQIRLWPVPMTKPKLRVIIDL